MEAQILKHNEGIKVKIPDIEKAIEAVEYMEKKSKEDKKSEEEKASLNIDFMVSNILLRKQRRFCLRICPMRKLP